MEEQQKRQGTRQSGVTGGAALEPATGAGSVLAEAAEGGNLDKVRDILFGAQSRDLDKRLARLEERLAKEAVELRADVARRFETLETFARTELEALADRLKAEQVERSSAIDAVVRELRETGKTLERQLSQLDERSVKSQRDLREQILERSKSLSDDLRRTTEALSAALERAVETLRHEKTDRTALAGLLTEMALRVTNEFKLPSGE